MAVRETEIRVDGGRRPLFTGQMEEEPPLGDLLRQLSNDATHLIQQEVELGKAELRESAAAIGRDAVKVGIALSLAWFAAMAATAFLIIGLGTLLGSYWLSALIVTVVYGGAAAVLASQARKDLKKRDLKPTRTVDTLREDADWAKREAEDVRREWKS